jgi:uncharacterized protein YbjQ (UPF0145 family)
MSTRPPKPWAAQLDGASLAALEATGFRPVGVAMGMSIYSEQYYAGYPATSSPIGRPSKGQRFYPCPHGRFGLTHTPGLNYQQAWGQAPRRMAMQAVLQKVRFDAHAMGAHGVIGLVINHATFRAGEPPIRQLRMTGTAVRAEGVMETTDASSVFTTTGGAGAFTELLLTGRAPTSVAFGNAVVAVMPGCVLRLSRRTKEVIEIDQLADASEMARAAAIDDLRSGASKAGAREIVGIDLDLGDATRVTTSGWTSIHAYAIGTAVARFEPSIGRVSARQLFRLRTIS